jgi:hypothetical protein
LRWGLMNFFVCQGWPVTIILLISASHIGGMTGMCHCTQLVVKIRTCKLYPLGCL